MPDSPAIKRWVAAGSPSRGPLALPAPRVALKRSVTARSLSPDAPEGEAPLCLLTELDGTPLYLHTRTGAVISLHHDATLSEVAAELATTSETPRAFADGLSREGSGIDLDALLGLARAVEAWPKWRPRGQSPSDRAKVMCEGLGVAPAKLAERLRERPEVYEWLGLDASALDDLARGVVRAPARAKATAAPSAPRVVEALGDLDDLAGVRSLDLRPRLEAEAVARLATRTDLEHLIVRLAEGAAVPSTLVNLQTLTVFNGSVPSLPRLERLTAWAPASLPRAMPRLVELSWQPADTGLSEALKAIASYPALRRLVIFNAWPEKPKIPAGFRRLAQLESLGFVNSAYARDAAGLRALREALKGCDVTAR